MAGGFLFAKRGHMTATGYINEQCWSTFVKLARIAFSNPAWRAHTRLSARESPVAYCTCTCDCLAMFGTVSREVQMIRRVVFFGAALLLSSSSSHAESYTDPSGRRVHTAKCRSAPTECFKEASQTCRGRYQVVDSESHAGGLLADIMPGPVTWYGMTYFCGTSGGKAPTFAFRGQQFQPQMPVYRPPATTNCTRIGNSLNCQTY
jgi:hypothetical protein